jgi:hypothetical protein
MAAAERGKRRQHSKMVVWQYTAICLLPLPSSWVFKTNEEKMFMAVQYQYSTTHKEACGLLLCSLFLSPPKRPALPHQALTSIFPPKDSQGHISQEGSD